MENTGAIGLRRQKYFVGLVAHWYPDWNIFPLFTKKNIVSVAKSNSREVSLLPLFP
jgi:hypothetical protein